MAPPGIKPPYDHDMYRKILLVAVSLLWIQGCSKERLDTPAPVVVSVSCAITGFGPISTITKYWSDGSETKKEVKGSCP